MIDPRETGFRDVISLFVRPSFRQYVSFRITLRISLSRCAITIFLKKTTAMELVSTTDTL
jgi:hypothetical protein